MIDKMEFWDDNMTWTTNLSDGSFVPVKRGCEGLVVLYEDREEYARLVRQIRMDEGNKQVR